MSTEWQLLVHCMVQACHVQGRTGVLHSDPLVLQTHIRAYTASTGWGGRLQKHTLLFVARNQTAMQCSQHAFSGIATAKICSMKLAARSPVQPAMAIDCQQRAVRSAAAGFSNHDTLWTHSRDMSQAESCPSRHQSQLMSAPAAAMAGSNVSMELPGCDLLDFS
jgi:hypothetical protein